MDPKSLASNTAALLALTIQVNGALYRDWDSGSSPIVDRLSYEFARLRTVLQILEEAAFQTDNPLVINIGSLPRIFMALRRCLILLGSKLLGDGQEIDVPSQNNLEMIWETKLPGKIPDTLPLSELDRESLLTDLSTHINCLMDLADLPDEPIKIMPPESFAHSRFWSHRAEYTEIHTRSQRDRVPGSGVWFLSNHKFKKWMQSDRIRITGGENILYCSGRPGSGKTILASTAIDEIKTARRQSSIGLAYFYFSYRNKTPISSVVLALLEQLYLQSSAKWSEIQKLQDSTSNPLERPLPELLSVLVLLLTRFRKVYIVLDALDEVSSENRSGLEALLSSFQSPHTRVLVTTRPSLDLRSLEKSPAIEIKPSQDDMRLFIDCKMKKIIHTHSLFSESQEAKIREALIKRGSQHGFFLLVGMQLNSIVHLFERGLPQDFNLDEVLQNLTGDLAQVYHDQITRITAQSAADCSLARNVISWLYLNSGSMSAVVLQDFLNSQSNNLGVSDATLIDTQRMGKVCLDLVYYDPITENLSFFHFSFHEYLKKVDETGNVDTLLPIPATRLAQSCIQYLLSKEVSVPTTDPRNVRQRLENSPFYSHAVHSWGRLLVKACEFNLVAEPQSALLSNLQLKRNVLEVLFLDEPKFFQSQKPDPFGMLHWITHSGLLKSPKAQLHPFHAEEINSRDFLERTPLHIAAVMGHAESIDAIVEIAMSIGGQEAAYSTLIGVDNMKRSALHHASIGGHHQAVHALIKNFGLVSSKFFETALRDGTGKTPLYHAAEGGHLNIVAMLLDTGFRFKDVDESLSIAIQHSHVQVVQNLVIWGVPLKDAHLMSAIEAGAEAVVKLLLRFGVEIPDLALHKAIGKKSIMSDLLWNRVDLEKLDSEGRTPLSIAVEANDMEAVKELLYAGANPEINVFETLDRKRTPVSGIVWAASQGMVEIFKLLRRAGADSSGVLFSATENGRDNIVRELLQFHQTNKLESSLTETAISLARERGYDKVAKLLEPDEERSESDDQESEFEGQLPPRKRSLTETHEPRKISSTQTQIPVDSDRRSAASQAGSDTHPSHTKEAMEIQGEFDLSRQRDLANASPKEAKVIVQSHAELNRDLSPSRTTQPSTSQSIPPIDSVNSSSGAVRISSKVLTPSSGKAPPAVFILLDSPVKVSHIPLGSLVRDPRNPLGTLGPVDPVALRKAITPECIHETRQEDFSMETQTLTRPKLAAWASTSTLPKQAKESGVWIRAPHVWRQQIVQHEQVLSRIFNEPNLRRDYVDFVVRGKERVYIVVGLFIMVESEVAIGGGTSSSVDVSMPIIPLAGVPIDIDLRVGSSADQSTKVSTKYHNPMIHAIQYRSIRVKSNRWSFRADGRKRDQVEIGGYFSAKDVVSLL
ncbi:Pfs, NACHT and ankyrin domain protein [Xylariaceae sp. FL0255]|nr:Pfs, NACHT and ankyrin domain protein [Xylariaceae sp. FL0255]